jgi:hypothetical protein
MKKTYFLLFVTCTLFTAFQCEEDIILTQENDKQVLISFKKEIEDLAATSVCNENTECKFIAFGSKHCGGPWSYLLYSTSIDVEKLENMVATYNAKEADFNEKWGVVSDCSAALPPTSINCENNTCIPVYQN